MPAQTRTPPRKKAAPAKKAAKKAAPAKKRVSLTTPPAKRPAPKTPGAELLKPSLLQQAQIELASRELARRRLVHFTRRINPRYNAGWVHHDICRRLEKFSADVAAGKNPRLMLLMPPRHGKSELASRMFPAWHLGHHPDHELIACSYNVSLAMTFSRKVKDVLNDPAYQSIFDVRLNPNFQGMEEWGIAGNTGGYVAAGVGGGITGKGAHILLIDDPIKNAEEADSFEAREKLWDWYGSTAYTRLAPGGGVLIIQTWWHDDDLAGRLQQAMKDAEADQFEVVRYAAIAEADEWLDTATGAIVTVTPQGRQAVEPGERMSATARLIAAKAVEKAKLSSMQLLRTHGEALHPERYRIEQLQRIKKTIPARFWSALYQQNPVPDEGTYFTKDQFRQAQTPRKELCNVFVAFDFAISTKQHNDYTVGVVGLQDCDDVLHIAEVVRFKTGDAHSMVDAILSLCQRWHTPTLQLGLEDGQIYRTLYALLMSEMKRRRQYPPLKVLLPVTDKEARARALQGRMQQGLVRFGQNAAWYETVRTELLRFPAGRNDDIVDAMAWLAQLVVGRVPPHPPKDKKRKSWRDRLGIPLGAMTHMAA